MADPTRFRVSRRVTFAATGDVLLYTPAASEVINVRQLRISTEDAVELVLFFGNALADRLVDPRAIFGVFANANAGGAPDLGCMGAWSPSGGLPIRLWASAACDVWVSLEGVVEP